MSFTLQCPLFQHIIKKAKSEWDAPTLGWLYPFENPELYWVLKLFEKYNIVPNDDEDDEDDEDEEKEHLIDDFEFYKTTPIKSSNGNPYASIATADEKNKYNCEDIWYTLKDNVSTQALYFYGNKNKNAITIKEGTLNNRPFATTEPGVYNYKIVMNKMIEIIYEINKHKPTFKLYVDKKLITGVYDDEKSDYNSKLKKKWKNETKKMWQRKSELGTFIHRNKKANILEWVPDKNYNPDNFNPEILNETTKLTLTRKNLPLPLTDVISSYIGLLEQKTHFKGGKRKTKKYTNSRKTRKNKTH